MLRVCKTETTHAGRRSIEKIFIIIVYNGVIVTDSISRGVPYDDPTRKTEKVC